MGYMHSYRVSYMSHAFEFCTHDHIHFATGRGWERGAGTSPPIRILKPKTLSSPVYTSTRLSCSDNDHSAIWPGPRVYHVRIIRHLGNNTLAPTEAYLCMVLILFLDPVQTSGARPSMVPPMRHLTHVITPKKTSPERLGTEEGD